MSTEQENAPNDRNDGISRLISNYHRRRMQLLSFAEPIGHILLVLGIILVRIPDHSHLNFENVYNIIPRSGLLDVWILL